MKHKFVTLLLTIVLLSVSVSAGFDLWNPSTWDDNVKFHDNGKFGYYEINDTDFWFFNNKPVKIITLIENDYSVFTAWNIKEIEVFRPSKLFDKTNYLDIERKHDRSDKIKSELQLFRKFVNKTDAIDNNVCLTHDNVTNITNGSTIEVCTEWNNFTTLNTYEAWTDWEEYHFGSVQAGLYQTKTIVERYSLKSGPLEWVDDNEGHSLVEWATWWDTTWPLKRAINLTVDAGNFSYLGNISFDSDMNANFSDLRFLDYATESIELNYTIERKVDGEYAEIRVFGLGEAGFYMYYGNPAAGSLSSSFDTHLEPIAYYYFDDTSGSVWDNVGIFNGTNNGATRGVDGYINNSFSFDGLNDYISLSDDVTNSTTTAAMSVWVNPISLDGADGVSIIAARGNNGNANYAMLYINPAGTIDFVMGGISTYLYDSSITTGTWQHVVMKTDGSNTTLYVDGVLQGKTVSDGSDGNWFGEQSGTDNFAIGILDRGTDYGKFNGSMDEVMFFDKDLSIEQVIQLQTYTEPTYTIGLEQSINTGPNVTLISPPNDTTVESNGYSADFVAFVTDPDVDTAISNCTLIVWNVSTGSIVYTQTNTTVTNNTNTTFTQVLMSSNYTWNVGCVDNQSAQGESAVNWTINIIPIQDKAPVVTLNDPPNNTLLTTLPADFNFSCDASDDSKLENVSLYIDNVLNQTNSSGLNATTYNFTVSNFVDGNYDWSCGAIDNSSQETRPTALLFTVHTDIPQVNITAPANASIVTETNQSIFLNWTITDFDLDMCWYNIGGANITVTCNDNTTTFNYPISNPDNVTITLYANDSVGRPGQDSVIIFRDPAGPTINITSPVDGFVVTEFNETIQLNWTVNDTNSDSCWYNIGGANTTVTCNDNTTTFNYPMSNPDNITTTFYANDTIGNINSDSITIFKTTIAPQITITSPVTDYALLTGGQSLDLNFSVINFTTLDKCWYSYSGVNTTVNCLTGNETSFTYVGSVNTITVYSNNTLGNVNSTTRTWTVDSTENSVTFNATTYETKTEAFILNITINESTVVSVSSILNYNGTRYTADSDCDGSICIIDTSIDVPLISNGIEESRVWFYEVTLFSATSELTSNSTANVQNVTKIFFEECNATYTTQALNFTAFDEQTLAAVDPFTFNADFEFWLGTGTVLRNNSFSNSSTSSVQLCISPINETFEVTGVVEYDEAAGSDYTIRNYYFQNDEINNVSQDIGLGLLLANQSTSFILKIQDADLLPFSEALIFTQRFYAGTGTFQTVQVGKTDDNGKTVGFFEAETGDYRFIIKKGGVTLLTTPDNNRSQKVVGEETPFTLTFTVGDDEGASWEDFEPTNDLTNSLLYNTTSQIVSFSYIDTSDDFTNASLEVYTSNSTGLNFLVCLANQTQSSGILTCNMTGNSSGAYIAKGIIFRDDLRILADQIGFEITDFAQLAGRLGLFLGWFIILISALAFKFNEVAGIILTNAAMVFVNLIGLVNFGVTWITAWIALSIIILVVMER